MNQKIGRNDPCPCGSGKKYKSCCLPKQSAGPRSLTGKNKITAKWINAPAGPNLIERAFGEAVSSNKKFSALKPETPPAQSEEQLKPPT